MRIAQVSHSLDCGGSMALVIGLSTELANKGHRVVVVCTDRPSGSAHESKGVQTLAQNRVEVQFLGRKSGSPGFAAAGRLWRLIQQREIDVVHSHLPMPDAMCGLVRRSGPRKFAHIVTVHNTFEPRSRVLTALASGADVVYCSEAARRRNPLPGVSSVVIPNGIPEKLNCTAEGCRAKVRQELQIPEEARVIIAVGRLCPQKGFDLALEALAIICSRRSLDNFQFLLCGEGKDREVLESRVSQLGLVGVVRFMNARTDIPDLLEASDVFLSTSRYEGMPLTVLEALWAGKPCVLSAIEEHREIASAMAGCRFASFTPFDIASALEHTFYGLLDAPALREQRGPFLQRHSIEQCSESYEKLYRTHCRSENGSGQERTPSGGSVARVSQSDH